MPRNITVTFADGSSHIYQNAPDDVTPEAVQARAQKDFGKSVTALDGGRGATTGEPQEYAGFFGSMGESASTLGTSPEAYAWQADPTPENRRKFLEAAQSKYKHAGFGEGHNLEALAELAGGSLGFLAAPAAAATAASTVTTPIGGIAAGWATGTSQYTVANLLRQAQEQEKAEAEGRTAQGPSIAKAVGAGAVQAGLDVAGEKILQPLFGSIPFVKNLIAPADKAVGKEAGAAFADAVQQGTLKPYKPGIWRGVGKGLVVEVPQEVAQQGLERWSAGMPLLDDDAQKEYLDTAIGAAILGGPMGAASKYMEGRAERKKEEAKKVLAEVGTDTTTGTEGEIQGIQGTPEHVAAVKKFMDEHGMSQEEAEALVNMRQSEAEGNEPTTRDTGVTTSGVDNTGDGAGVSVPSVQTGGERAAPQVTETEAGGVGVPGGSTQPVRGTTGNVPSTLTPTQKTPTVVTPEVPKKTSADVILDVIRNGGNKRDMTKAMQALFPDADHKSKGFQQGIQQLLGAMQEAGKIKFNVDKAKWELTQPGVDIQAKVSAEADVKNAQRQQQIEAENKLKEQAAEEERQRQAAAQQAAQQQAAEEEERQRQAAAQQAAQQQAAEEEAQRQVQTQEQAAAAEAERIAKAKADRARKAAEEKRKAIAAEEKQARLEAAQAAQTAQAEREELPPLAEDATPEQILEWTKAREALDKKKAKETRAVEKASEDMEEEEEEEAPKRRYAKRAKPVAPKFVATATRVEPTKTETTKTETTKVEPSEAKPVNPKLAALDVEDAFVKLQARVDQHAANTELNKAKEDADKQRKNIDDKTSRRGNPDGPFEGSKGQVVASADVDPRYVAYLRSLVKALKVDSLRIFLTHPADAANNADVYGLWGGYESGATLSQSPTVNGEAGVFGKDNKDFKLGIRPGMSEAKTLEIIAHELGHILQRVAFDNAPKHVQEAVREEYKVWRERMMTGGPNGGVVTLRQLLSELRNRHDSEDVIASTKGLAAKQGMDFETLTLKDIDYKTREYFLSFPEWFADNVSRWTTTSATPLTVVDKFFKSVADMMRRLVKAVTGQQFLPNSKVAEFLDDMHAGGLDVTSIWEKAPIPTRNLQNTMEVTLTDKSVQQISTTQKTVSKEMEKVQLSRDATTQAEGVGSAIKNHDTEKLKDAIDDTISGLSVKNLIRYLKILPSSVILRKARETVIGRPLDSAAEMVEGMAKDTNNLKRKFSEIGRRFEAFIAVNGQKVLGDTLLLARLHQVSPVAWSKNVTVDQAIKSDDEIKHYEDLIAKSQDPSKAKRYQKKLNERSDRIKEVYTAWTALGKQEKGHAFYTEITNFYKDMHDITRNLLDKDIDNLPISDDAKAALKAQAKSTYKLNAKGEIDTEADGLFRRTQVEAYFPFKRYGQYWLTVVGGPTGKEFYTFESIRERNAFQRKRATQLGIDVKSSRFDRGADIRELQQRHFNDSSMLKEMFRILDETKTKGGADINKIKDELAQVWLSTLPERSARRQWMHSENVTGFSTDVFRVFKDSANGYSRQIAKLRFGNRIRNEISAARDLLKPEVKEEEGLSADEREKLRTYVNEIASRAEDEISPPPRSGYVTGFNRVAFIWFLSGPATAMTQMTSIPIRVMPKLNAKYGYAASAKMFTKYMAVWNSFGTKSSQEGEDTWVGPSVGTSSMVKGNPRAGRFYEAGLNHNSFTPVSDAIVTEDRRTDISKFDKGLQNTYKWTTALFNASERISREIAFMMHAELAYNEHIKNGKDAATAEKLAIKDAVEGTRDAMGNYSEFERPSAMRGDIRRALFLFKMYAVNQTKFFLGSLHTMVKGKTPQEKWAAFHELSGVLTMAGLFGGVVGLPLYSIICDAIDLLWPESDEEKQKRRAESPYTADSADARFRYEWLPKHFGDSTLFGHQVSKILERGLVSEVSGANVGSRTSFDGMWFRDPQYSPTYAGKLQNLIQANLGPNVSLGTNIAGALDDFNEGRIGRGLEKFLPAIGKGAVTAYRLGTEGSETYKGDTMVDPKDLSGLQLVAQTAGFQPTDVSDAQNRRSILEGARAKMTAEKVNVLGRWNVARWDKSTSPEDYKRIYADIVKFNNRYPQEENMITEATLDNSEDSFDKIRDNMLYGSELKDEELPYAKWYYANRKKLKK